MNRPLLSIENLFIKGKTDEKVFINNISIKLTEGEIVSLIGESGSGKSLTARAILGLLPLTMSVYGRIYFKNKDVLSLSSKEHRTLLGNEIGMIFQDYRGTFTPFIKIGKQMVETIRTHQKMSKKEAKEVAYQVLEKMGLDSKKTYQRYPFQLSGGQTQRAAIALALALRPSLIICDEMTTALDVISGEKVLDYIDQLRKETGCAVLMITHDLTLAYKRADRIYVMNQGEIVEEGFSEEIRCYHKHPYTKKLCSCLLTLPNEVAGNQKERVESL
ncbi:peptide/nickel transport system ATP-binding protein [Bacillus mesophilus]|uniref:ABC transporter ATP-binding protein n=1 Tax=Bacillus mesophilus TaxID=1808955 RepID=A0A6M0QBD2_9BACI|nr:ABC transporter ATP-binding protein [Bacillus mesophilus]MBM7661817.1 peptide/nickel transport system ATP-binding protein [Bacillus mesophilus]NEY72820.1 ABC transporter ATP-binding protein [Bacillus mesophilus]